MSEQKRNSLTSLGTNKKDKKLKDLSKTVRFTLNLPESNEEACPEFNYRVLLSSAEKKRKQKLIKGDGHVNGVDPLAEDDDDKLKEIARHLEEKYGGSGGGGRKKHSRFEDYVDLGAGYDENDPFIDNTDAYDEVVPEEITTAHGGFYINCGALEFKEVSDQSDAEEIKDLKARRRIKKTFNAIDEDDDDVEGPKTTVNILQGTKKPKTHEEKNELVKKRKFVSHDREIFKKKKKRAIDDLMKKKAVTVKELLREKRESLEIEPALVTESVQDEKKPVVNSLPKPVNTSIADVIESVVSAARAEDDLSKDSTSSISKSVSGSVSSDTDASQDAEVGEKEKTVPKEEVKLPETVSEDLRDLVVCLKKAAQSSADGKCKFFSMEVNQMLLNVEQKCQVLPCTSRHLVYSHLACYLPCTKDTLMKRAKKLRLLAEEIKIQEPLKKLEAAITNIMPVVMEKYSRECQRVAEEKSIEEPASPSSDPEKDVNKVSCEKVKIPRRRFPWTNSLRALICDVVRIKLQCLDLKKPRKETAEELLRSFLEQQVKPLWPPGWMKVTTLLRESRLAQTTTVLKSKKATVTAKKHSTNLLAVSVTPSVISSTTSTNAMITATATSTACNNTARAPKVLSSTQPVAVATAPRMQVPSTQPVAVATAPRMQVPSTQPVAVVTAPRMQVPSTQPVAVATAPRMQVPSVSKAKPVLLLPEVSAPLLRPVAPTTAKVKSNPLPLEAPAPLGRLISSSNPVLTAPSSSITVTVAATNGTTLARGACSPVPTALRLVPPVSTSAPTRAKAAADVYVRMPCASASVKTVPSVYLEKQSLVRPVISSPEVKPKGNIDRIPAKGLDLSISGTNRVTSVVSSAQNKVLSGSELSIIPVSVSLSSSSAQKSPVAALPLINIPDCISVTPSLSSPSQTATITATSKPMMSLKQRILYDTAKERSNSSVNIVNMNINVQPPMNKKDDEGIEVIEIVDETVVVDSLKAGNQKQRSVKCEVPAKPKTEAKKRKKDPEVTLPVSKSVLEDSKQAIPPISEKEAEQRLNEETAAATDFLSQIINESLTDLSNSGKKEIYNHEEKQKSELYRQEEKTGKEVNHREEKPRREVVRQDDKTRREFFSPEDKSTKEVYREEKLRKETYHQEEKPRIEMYHSEDKLKKDLYCRDDKPRKEIYHQEERTTPHIHHSILKTASPPSRPVSCESNGPNVEDDIDWEEEEAEKLKCETPQPADSEVSVQLEVDRVMKELIELQGHMSGGKATDIIDNKYSPPKISSSVSVVPISSAVISRSQQQLKNAKELDIPVVTCKPVLSTRRPSSGSEFTAAAKFSHGFQEEFQKHLFQEIPRQDLQPVSIQIAQSKAPVYAQINPMGALGSKNSRSSSPEGSASHGRSFVSNTQPRSRTNSNSSSLYSKLASANVESYTGAPYVSRLPTSANSSISHFQDIKSNIHGSQSGSNQHSPPF